jgi:hypothetical protein
VTAGGALKKPGQVVQRADQKRIARCAGDGAVKFHVFLGPVAPGLHGFADALHGIANGLHIGFTAALGGQFGHFRLQSAAHFHDLHDRLARCGVGQVKVQGLNARRFDVTPLPWRESTRPSDLRREIASRTTVRLTSNCCASAASVGSLSPAWMRPSRISASNALATWSESLMAGLMAAKDDDMAIGMSGAIQGSLAGAR